MKNLLDLSLINRYTYVHVRVRFALYIVLYSEQILDISKTLKLKNIIGIHFHHTCIKYYLFYDVFAKSNGFTVILSADKYL